MNKKIDELFEEYSDQTKESEQPIIFSAKDDCCDDACEAACCGAGLGCCDGIFEDACL